VQEQFNSLDCNYIRWQNAENRLNVNHVSVRDLLKDVENQLNAENRHESESLIKEEVLRKRRRKWLENQVVKNL